MKINAAPKSSYKYRYKNALCLLSKAKNSGSGIKNLFNVVGL